MNSAVSAFLSRHNFVRHVDVNVLAESILDDMNRGLRKEKSDEDKEKPNVETQNEEVEQ